MLLAVGCSGLKRVVKLLVVLMSERLLNNRAALGTGLCFGTACRRTIGMTGLYLGCLVIRVDFLALLCVAGGVTVVHLCAAEYGVSVLILALKRLSPTLSEQIRDLAACELCRGFIGRAGVNIGFGIRKIIAIFKWESVWVIMVCGDFASADRTGIVEGIDVCGPAICNYAGTFSRTYPCGAHNAAHFAATVVNANAVVYAKAVQNACVSFRATCNCAYL